MKDQRKKGKTLLLSYDRSELKTSDHRPVGAVFKVETFKVDGKKCVELIEDVVELVDEIQFFSKLEISDLWVLQMEQLL